MQNETLRTIGQALYGPFWQRALAAELGVSDRTMRRWAAGEINPPPGVYAELTRILRIHSAQCDALAKSLDRR
jgi:ribosome-binding protein aMBF1 (putative translation factor)